MSDGTQLWMALGAPRFDDPDERHGHARIHLLQHAGAGWRHLGPAMPDGFSPGSREWSGSCVLEPETGEVTLFFTATGERGEEEPSFKQRIFRARATLELAGGKYGCREWCDLAAVVRRDPAYYMAGDDGTGTLGTIKAFRDPAHFHDPASGEHFLFFTGSAAGSASAFNGVVGAATAATLGSDEWAVLPPIVCADGLNNELERPHMVLCDGLYYLFWSTQSHVFNPEGPAGPTGLYGMVGTHPLGSFEPLNSTGLVFANPRAAPRQAYSWLVMPDLRVASFADDWGEDNPPGRKRRFGATFAPMLQLELDGAQARLAG